MAAEVARIIRGWSGEEPRALWERLRAEGWGELTEPGEVARWDLVQSWSWRCDGGRYDAVKAEGAANAGYDATFGWDAQTPEKLASRVEAVARWLVAAGWAYQSGDPETGLRPRINGQEATDRLHWQAPASPAALADRVRSWPVPVRVFPDARAVPIPEGCRGVYVYADPSYKHPDGTPTSGYAQNIYAEDLRERLLEWSARGAVVAISDARDNSGLMGEGWTAFEIGTERVGQKRTFSRQQAEWLTLNRPPAWRPGRQEGLPWAR
jgi:hypothetical protein